MERSAILDELVRRMNNPRVVVDNTTCATETLVKVDSASCRNCILLTAIQVLADLDLVIKKAYISADGPWFMDVFHVADRRGLKLFDPKLLARIEQSICDSATAVADRHDNGSVPLSGMTALELTGADRPGLLSDVFAVLRDLDCSVVEAKVWTHNGRAASLVFLQDVNTRAAIEDAGRIGSIEIRLRNILRGDDHDVRVHREFTHSDRRLHELMLSDSKYERAVSAADASTSTSISIQNLAERGYYIISVQCLDRPKLMLDTVCSLANSNYVVFHGTTDTFGGLAYQEYYVRRSKGTPAKLEDERQKVIKGLQTAIERRTFGGLRLELQTADEQGLLAQVTRTFRESGLSVTGAEIKTRDRMAMSVFHVTDASGHLPDRTTINGVIERIGRGSLKLNEEEPQSPPGCHYNHQSSWAETMLAVATGGGLLSLGSLVMRNLGLIRS